MSRSFEIRLENCPALGTDVNLTSVVSPRVLVMTHPPKPSHLGAIDIFRPQRTEFTGPYTGETLKANHVTDDLGKMRQCLLNHRVGNMPYFLEFSCICTICLEQLHGFHGHVLLRRNQLSSHRPSKDHSNGLDGSINCLTWPVVNFSTVLHASDFFRSECMHEFFKKHRSEGCSRHIIKLSQRANSGFDITKRAGMCAIRATILFFSVDKEP